MPRPSVPPSGEREGGGGRGQRSEEEEERDEVMSSVAGACVPRRAAAHRVVDERQVDERRQRREGLELLERGEAVVGEHQHLELRERAPQVVGDAARSIGGVRELKRESRWRAREAVENTAEPICGVAFEFGRDPRAPRAPGHGSRIAWCPRIALKPNGWRDCMKRGCRAERRAGGGGGGRRGDAPIQLIVVEHEQLDARQHRHGLELADLVVRQVQRIELVLRHSREGRRRCCGAAAGGTGSESGLRSSCCDALIGSVATHARRACHWCRPPGKAMDVALACARAADAGG